MSVDPLGELVPSAFVSLGSVDSQILGLRGQDASTNRPVKSLTTLQALAGPLPLRAPHAGRSEAQKRGAIPAGVPGPNHHKGYYCIMEAVKNAFYT